MIKYKVSGIVKIDKQHQDNELWERHGYELKKPYISENDILAYKITAGLYIFYITEQVYNVGVSLGIIEKLNEETKEINFSDMLCSRGLVCYHRIGYALEHSTIEYLQSELQRVNNEDKLPKITHYTCDWYENGKRLNTPKLTYVDEVWVDLEKREIIKKKVNDSISKIDRNFSSSFHLVKTYDNLLDELAYNLDRSYCNSRHLIDKYRDVGFYSVDHFLTQQEKFDFTFIKEGCVE